MKENETYSQYGGAWEQPTASPVPIYTDTSEKKGNQEYVHGLLVEQLQERDGIIDALRKEMEGLRREKEDFDELKKKYDNLRERYEERDAECHDLKKEVRRLENANKALVQNQETSDSQTAFPYVYEQSHFNKNSNIPLFFDHLFELCNIKVRSNKYLIANKSSIAPVFLILKNDIYYQNTSWQFLGTEEHFVDYWNENVVSKINDVKRQEALRLNVDSFHTTIYTAPFKGKNPQSWENLLKYNRNKTILIRAVDIRNRMKQIFR